MIDQLEVIKKIQRKVFQEKDNEFVQSKTPPDTEPLFNATLTNYDNQFVFLSGGYHYCKYDGYSSSYKLEEYVDDVHMYDILKDSWSVCPERQQKGSVQSSFCVDGKLYLLFGSTDN